MGLIEDLAARAEIRIHGDSVTPLVSLTDARTFVDACESEGVSILGIDSFETIGSSVVSRIDEIADFSMDDGSSSSFDAAREFIKWLGKRDRMLEFVLDEGR